MSNQDEILIKSISVLTLNPKDILVVNVDAVLRTEQITYLKTTITKMFENAGYTTVPQVAILQRGIEFSKIESEDAHE